MECRGTSWWQSDGVTDTSETDAAPAGFQPGQSYRPGRWRRLENAVMSALISAGLVPRSYLLTRFSTAQAATRCPGSRYGATKAMFVSRSAQPSRVPVYVPLSRLTLIA